MSTENEGAAVPPEAQPPTAPQASDRAPEAGARTSDGPGARDTAGTQNAPATGGAAEPQGASASGTPAPAAPEGTAGAQATPSAPDPAAPSGTGESGRAATPPAPAAPPPPEFAPTAGQAGASAADGAPGRTQQFTKPAEPQGHGQGHPQGQAHHPQGQAEAHHPQDTGPYAGTQPPSGGEGAHQPHPHAHQAPPPAYATAHGASDGGWGGPTPPGYGGGAGGPGDVWGAPGAPAPKKRRNGGLIAAVLVAALVAGGIGGGIGFWAANRNDTNSTTVSASGDPEALNRKPTSVSGIAQKALPSVVTIEAQGATGEGGTGTGFVYDKQGHILTNNHVVASAAQGGRLTATFSNGKKYDAEVIGRAQGYDVAVIKLKNPSDANLVPLPLGKSANVQVGDATIAIGAPFGLSGTVTT
ncbi:trypsin-like peptidase domain-containing protein, partial [Streptomyces rimosus]